MVQEFTVTDQGTEAPYQPVIQKLHYQSLKKAKCYEIKLYIFILMVLNLLKNKEKYGEFSITDIMLLIPIPWPALSDTGVLLTNTGSTA